MAAKNLRGFGWFICLVLVAPPCYLVSSRVAAERARVDSLNRAIVSTKREIRELETEFQTRANLAQLERWNGEVLSLAAPRPEQFLAGEEALAALHTAQPGEPQLQPATYIVPAGLYDNALHQVAEPVGTPAPRPAERPAGPVALAAAAVASPERATPLPAAAPRRKAQAVAMLDDTLLSSGTMGELMRGARSETVKRR